jgi:GNAT superfamily N-acetyltransferase
VHPDYRNQGIGRELLRLADAHVLKLAQADLPPDMPVSMSRNISDRNVGAKRLFEDEGYAHVRSSYRMKMELDHPIDVPPLPEGITLHPFDVARDGHRVYEAHQEIWQDHRGFEASSWEEWSHFLIEPTNNDFSMWLTAYDGDEMAGICITRPYGDVDAQMMWVRILGVRRPWRKRGLGMALLTRAFVLFQQKGYKRVGLGVDAASLTNAVALYERAGMHVWQTMLGYRKMLRGETAE